METAVESVVEFAGRVACTVSIPELGGPPPLPKAAEFAGASALRALVWDVVGNPFRSVEFDPAWRTETALALARQMYETHEFSAMEP